MSTGRLLSALIVVGFVVVGIAHADGSGSGSGSDSVMPVAVGSGSGSADGEAVLPTEVDSLKQVATAYHQKDWYLLAGALLALAIYAARWVLAKKWPRWGESHYAVLLAAAMAGLASVSVAWSTGADVTSSHSLIGALKIFAFATVSYVAPKKVIPGMKQTGTTSTSDAPT